VRNAVGMCAVLLAAVLAAPVQAANEDKGQDKVDFRADLVLVSNQGSSMDPGLEFLKDMFAKEHFNFTSYKRLSSETLRLEGRKPRDIKLPNGQTATLKLLKVEHGTATVEVSVGKIVAATYTVGREGSVLVNAGHRDDGEVFLVLSPASGGK